MIVRHVPAGTEGDFAGARYAVKGTLPAILARRQTNRGIESMAVSPDERFLYVIMQNPLANPDAAAYRAARNTRLLKFERATMNVVGEYVYTLDDPKSFRRDPSEKQNDPRISELMAVGLDRLIVLERTELTTKLYEVSLAAATNIAGSRWDDPATRPTLEQIDLAATEIKSVPKQLRLDTADFPEIVGKRRPAPALPAPPLLPGPAAPAAPAPSYGPSQWSAAAAFRTARCRHAWWRR
jgi:hypothetical protein